MPSSEAERIVGSYDTREGFDMGQISSTKIVFAVWLLSQVYYHLT